jgi:hypothetical protein
MGIEITRDVVIIVSGIVVIVVSILAAILLYSTYTRLNAILKSLKTTAAEIEALTDIASNEICQPLAKTAGMVQSLAMGICSMGNIFRKGG